MSKWILPTLSEVVAQGEQLAQCNAETPLSDAQKNRTENSRLRHSEPATSPSRNAAGHRKAERQWCGAIAALVSILEQIAQDNRADRAADRSVCSAHNSYICPIRGLILSGPLPVLSHPQLLAHYTSWLFATDGFYRDGGMPFQLPPAANTYTPPHSANPHPEEDRQGSNWLSLSTVDPLKTELFCLALTRSFGLVLVWSENEAGEANFQFSFSPQVIEQCWQALRSRVALNGTLEQLQALDAYYEQFAPKAPDYTIVAQFSQGLLEYLPDWNDKSDRNSVRHTKETTAKEEGCQEAKPRVPDASVELLSAIAHEVKTPLTTIRTLTRLLLKRRDLPEVVLDRLHSIDRECTEQIDRFGLIFRAVEMETHKTKESTRVSEREARSQTSVQLTPTSLSQVFQQSIPRWQKQAGRRNLTLDVALPQKMPAVVSDPTLLDQVLTGLIENFTSSLPRGSHVTVEVTPAGSQLKLQFQSQLQADPASKNTKTLHNNCATHLSANGSNSSKPTLKSLGQLLMFQPETGHLSLNMSVTKNLFQAIGGKLIVRQRPQQGQVLTIFLPLNLKEL
ncbi:HAMP domain-containing sensor histidine kinase [Desertifilum tharense]|uniref:sensor histidine kinase n=1 Tax=Desertifilum TaxID=1185872 RepID=UPI000AB95AD3|nr:HAMP domain-containing sensor histidine kinase [Desertifilum tharense]MDA0209496.1 HAMP domain-containing sensor histidine kinase [Cyanobacteria bacterium FC1]